MAGGITDTGEPYSAFVSILPRSIPFLPAFTVLWKPFNDVEAHASLETRLLNAKVKRKLKCWRAASRWARTLNDSSPLQPDRILAECPRTKAWTNHLLQMHLTRRVKKWLSGAGGSGVHVQPDCGNGSTHHAQSLCHGRLGAKFGAYFLTVVHEVSVTLLAQVPHFHILLASQNHSPNYSFFTQYFCPLFPTFSTF